MIPTDQALNMSVMLEVGLQGFVKTIEDTCISASKEYGYRRP